MSVFRSRDKYQRPVIIAYLGQGPAGGSIAAGVAILRAGVSGDVAVLALEAISAQTLEVVGAGQILAHGAVRAGALHTITNLVLSTNQKSVFRSRDTC